MVEAGSFSNLSSCHHHFPRLLFPALTFPPLPLPNFLLRYKASRAWYKSEESEEGNFPAASSVNDEDVHETKQEENAFKEEERVLHWDDGWYPAMVIGITGNGTLVEPYTYCLRYDDGEECGAAREEDMVKLEEDLEKWSFEEQVRIHYTLEKQPVDS